MPPRCGGRFEVVEAAGRERLLLDAMVLAAGLTSRREPASFSRRLVELGIDGAYDLVVTETLLDELHRVLTSPKFIAQMSDEEAPTAIDSLAAVAWKVVSDMNAAHEHLTNDPNDD